ncbi:hypothetical protein WM40_24740 [Robbsia andropogonis]|uniref:phosphoglycolate phosphatase n=1 Tax=Robbsia andropogonis TaxID=28092 RepID=A0A0F5JU43_9BURK|nr:HAD family hydrolase [Robbsia andropogonis]KKB61165.1 hypothetical protein WM40_24740 [Robbsia andropogonis]
MKKLLITDVDNTLFDWVNVWHQSFQAMLDELCRTSGLKQETLYSSIRAVHQRHGTSEYSFLLEEIPEIKEIFRDSLPSRIQPAIDAFRAARTENLQLYPGVKESLTQLRDLGIPIVAYTESQAFYTQYRFRKLGLDHLIDFVYSPADHALPIDDIQSIRKYSADNYQLAHTEPRFTPDGELKPNPHILASILQDMKIDPSDAIYIGDSLMKDIAMAQDAGVDDAWAKYGLADIGQYDLLKKVSHWSEQDIAREKKIFDGRSIRPSNTLQNGFHEILNFFQ